jgi:protein-tyrosine-phosphatase
VTSKPTIIFVCEHGAAKSIIAAAYFNKLANDAGLPAYALARGTHPDKELSAPAREGLSREGLIPTETAPQKLTRLDLETAEWIVSFCNLPPEFPEKKPVKLWEGIPAVNESYEAARNAIVDQLKHLIEDIRRSK